jgi:glucan biosynthesis protein C
VVRSPVQDAVVFCGGRSFLPGCRCKKRGIGGMLTHRFARVLLPFMVFWPLVYGAMAALAIHATDNVENLSPLLAMIKLWLADPNRPAAPPTLMHLWFLPYVMCFCVLTWMVHALEIEKPRQWFESMRPRIVAGVAPLLLVPALVGVPAPFPTPESVFPQWWALLFYGVYFALGFRLFHDSTWIDQLVSVAPRMLATSMAGYALFFVLLQS